MKKSGEKNGESGAQKEQGEKKPKPNEDQYKLLLSCSEKKDITDWNRYRKEHPNDVICLQGANLSNANLQSANLREANLQGVNFVWANLQGANFRGANLQGADLQSANLQDANISAGANLQGAKLVRANLQNADLRGVNLQSANFWMAIVDGGTLISSACIVNRWCKSGRFTDFEGVGLDSMRIAPEIKQLLEYNIRRKNWEEWYSKHLFLKWPVRLFWSISDYGLSSVRIMLSFILLVLIFGTIYFAWGGLIITSLVSMMSRES